MCQFMRLSLYNWRDQDILDALRSRTCFVIIVCTSTYYGLGQDRGVDYERLENKMQCKSMKLTNIAKYFILIVQNCTKLIVIYNLF